MENYPLLKSIHVITVLLSISGFLLRAYWRFFSPRKLQLRLTRVLPHINDSLLLISAITLTVLLQQYPFVQNWLTAKLLLLIVYIIAGSVTLKLRYSKSTSLTALAVAAGSFAGIVWIALHRSFS